MVSGIYDIFNHICEQYFSGEDDNTSDYISEGLMRSVIHASRIANKDSQDYEARSNLMWAATWALNTLVSRGKSTDWMVHMIGQSVGAYTNATHGMTLSAVSLPYYRYILSDGVRSLNGFNDRDGPEGLSLRLFPLFCLGYIPLRPIRKNSWKR